MTTRIGGPENAGSVFWTDAKTLASPTPNVLSGPASEIAVAPARIMLRTFVRALTGSAAPAAPLMRHDAPCSTSAASPATCGAAADVPKNGFSKLPAAVTPTPSIAEISGFSRPSSVGPRLLKNSIV